MIRTGAVAVFAEAKEAIATQRRGTFRCACFTHLSRCMFFVTIVVHVATVLDEVCLIRLGATLMLTSSA